MQMLSEKEKSIILDFANHKDYVGKEELIQDLDDLLANNSIGKEFITSFSIAGYARPVYKGQHSAGVEGRLLDEDGAALSMYVFNDENERILEIEIVRWDGAKLKNPQWDKLQVF